MSFRDAAFNLNRTLWLVPILILSILLGACRTAPAGPLPSTAPPQTSPVVETVQPVFEEEVPGGALKVLISEEGLYSLPGETLRQAGLDPQATDPPLRLTERGVARPFWIAADGSLQFYARPAESRYSHQNVYWLTQGPAAQALFLPPDPLEDPNSEALPTDSLLDGLQPPQGAYLDTFRLEENLIYNPQVESGDHWLWQSLAAPGSLEFQADLPDWTAGPGRLRLSVWANTQAEQDPDHRLILKVNGSPVADESWDGKGRHILQADIPSGAWQSGAVQVNVEAPGLEGILAEIVFIDNLQIGYPRPFQVYDDRLTFSSPGGEHHLGGFSGPVDVYQLDGNGSAERIISGADSNDVNITAQPGQRYWVVGPDGYRRPAGLEAPAADPDLRAAGLGADFLAVGPSDLLEPLAPLLELRESQGLKTRAAPLTAVYDQFNAGLPEPEAIRSLLRYAVQNWEPAPRYLLLVGDGSYDTLGYQASPEANRLPVFLVETVYGGETASDVIFTQLDEDDQPDLTVGRIPAGTSEQVAVFAEKVLAYESQSGAAEPWKSQVLAVADGQEAHFSQDAQNFLNLFPEGQAVDLIAPPPGTADAAAQIRQRIEAGSGLVAYFGHGSVSMWGKDRLFTTEDVQGLDNGERLPVVINMTCLNGLFTHPKVESLAEALLWQPDGGAVAVLAPTSLTLPTDQSFLSRALVEGLREPDARLGDALLSARRKIPVASPGARDVMETFLLFGDPAMRVGLVFADQ